MFNIKGMNSKKLNNQIKEEVSLNLGIHKAGDGVELQEIHPDVIIDFLRTKSRLARDVRNRKGGKTKEKMA